MVKVTGQSVPSEDKHAYESCLELARTDGTVRKRFPKKIAAHPLPAKLIQQQRFKDAVKIFKTLSAAERQRWWENQPVWNSYLWYYDYCIMSALMGNANSKDGGAGVIKSIQLVKESVPTTGGKSFAISTVDPAKTVVLVYGNSFINDLIHHYDGENPVNTEHQVDLSPSIDPNIAEIRLKGSVSYIDIAEGSGDGRGTEWIVTQVTAAYIKIKAVTAYPVGNWGWSMDIIEHKAQTIYPVITSIGVNAVVIDWSKEPSVAADVSIIVIEYI